MSTRAGAAILRRHVPATAPRDVALTRLQCPACDGMLAPPPGGFGAACLDCDRQFPSAGDVLELFAPGRPPTPRRREYPHQGRDLSFWQFYEQTLRLGAYRDTDLEEEVYALLGGLDHDPGEPILLLGCGRGELLSTVAAACPDSVIVATDDHPGDLDIARRRLSREGAVNCAFVACDLDHPPLRAGSFRAVLHFGLIHALPDGLDHMRRFARVLPPGGHVAGVALARSTLPHIARAQAAMANTNGLRWVPMQEFGTRLMKLGWSQFRHEQPSNWMARFVATRGAV